MRKFLSNLLLVTPFCLFITDYARAVEPIPVAPTEQCQAAEGMGNLSGFLFQYQLGNNDVTTSQFCIDQTVLTTEQLAWLEGINKQMILQVETQSQPVNFSAEVSLLSASDFPPFAVLSLMGKTYEDKNGMIQTDVVIPQYQQKIPESEQHFGFSIDWAGAMIKTRFAKTELWQQLAEALIAGKSITAEMLKGKSVLLDISKDIMFDVNMPRLAFNFGDEFQMVIEGLKADALYKDAFSPSRSSLTIPTMRLSGADVQVKISDLAAKTNVHITSSGLEIANVDLQTKQVMMENQGIQLNQFTLQSDGEEVGDIVNGSIHTELDELVLPEILFGKTYHIHYKGNFALRHLDTGSLKKFQDKFKELQRQQYSTRPLSGEMVGMVIIGQLMQALPKLWAKSPEFAISDLELNMAQGKLVGQGYIGIDGSKPLSIKDFSKFIAALRAKAEVVADEAVVKLLLNLDNEAGATEEELEEQIDEWVEQGNLIAMSEGRYQITLHLQEGELLINGQKSDWQF